MRSHSRTYRARVLYTCIAYRMCASASTRITLSRSSYLVYITFVDTTRLSRVYFAGGKSENTPASRQEVPHIRGRRYTQLHGHAGTRRRKSLGAGSRRISVRDTLTDGRTLSFENGSHLVAETPISHGK